MDKSEWKNMLQSRGLRLTGPRVKILEILKDTREHLSAEDLYLRVHSENPSIGLTTVYRTMELLEKMGIVSKFQFGDGRSRYELIESPNKPGHHHHLVCVNCKRIVDYEDFVDEEVKLLQKVETALSEKFRFNISSHVIQFYGTCFDCRENP
ncbi:MAG: Fur family transcriptional regulator [Calditrichia bacterium]